MDLGEVLNYPNKHMEKLEHENIYLKDQVEKLKDKVRIINEYYQSEMKKLRKQTEEVEEIDKLKQEIEILKSKALANPRKITDDKIEEVKKLRLLGYSYKKISKETSISTTTICRILNGEYK